MTTVEIEKYGTGFIRIRKSLADYPELELNFLNLSDFLRIELIEKSNVGLNVGLNEGKVLKLIQDNPGITNHELAEILKLTKRSIERYISALKEINRIKRIGSKKTGYWKILKNE